MKMMDFLIATYPSKPQVQRLKANFKPDPNRILESTPDAENTSYSVNKGESVHFCLRQRDNDQLVNENIMMFVALHEMGHVITQEIGHTPEFWNNFGWLLREAEAQKLYKYEDFKAHPTTYCGVKITDVDADQNPDIAIKFSVRGVPTIIFLKDGSVADRKTGIMSESQITEIITKLKQ